MCYAEQLQQVLALHEIDVSITCQSEFCRRAVAHSNVSEHMAWTKSPIGIVFTAKSISTPLQHFCLRQCYELASLDFRHLQQIDSQLLMFGQANLLNQLLSGPGGTTVFQGPLW